MTTRGKKPEKKQPLSSTKVSAKKDEKPVVTKAPAAPVATTASERVLDVAPIEVLQDKPLPATPVVEPQRTLTNEERRRLIALAAYDRAQRTGFGKTDPVEDWLLAEREVDAMMAAPQQFV